MRAAPCGARLRSSAKHSPVGGRWTTPASPTRYRDETTGGGTKATARTADRGTHEAVFIAAADSHDEPRQPVRPIGR